MDRVTDYDSLAAAFDRRYEEYDYRGYERALLEFIQGSAGVLEVGCGTGHWLRLLAGRIPLLAGTDPSANMLKGAQGHAPGVPLVRGRAEALPWAGRSFDRLFCVNAFHHFAGKEAFLAEARRVLRPGGALLTIGMDPHQERDHWWIHHYFPETVSIDRGRYLPVARIRREMARAGFAHCETKEVQRYAARLSARDPGSRRVLEKGFTSQLAVLSDGEYEAGLARVREGMATAASRGEELMLVSDFGIYATLGQVD